MKIKIFLIAGARPNFMKIAPVYKKMMEESDLFEPIIVHTGQHYDENMSKIFFDDLELPKPHIYLGVGSGSHAEQTAEIMRLFEPELLKHKPDVILVVGDVNSTIACALAAIKARIPSNHLAQLWKNYEYFINTRNPDYPLKSAHHKHCRSHDAPIIAHIESGLRSFDFDMPEEINRVTTDILSDLLFTTSNEDDQNLVSEGIDPRKIFMVGNVMIDSLENCILKSQKSNILEELNFAYSDKIGMTLGDGNYILTTLHRASNVDHLKMLKAILSALYEISLLIPVIFPMHPRTRKLVSQLDQSFLTQISNGQLLISDPVGYLDFLHLQSRAKLVLTDSGGAQVESCYLGVPCLTLRPNTEWLVTVNAGMNHLVNPDKTSIVAAANKALAQTMPEQVKIKYWDGSTASRIIKTFKSTFYEQEPVVN